MPITQFNSIYSFLSTTYLIKIDYEDITYNSVENAYQAAKTLNADDKFKIAKMRPREAIEYGKKVKVRRDWDDIKDTIMFELTRIKFNNDELKKKLIGTGGEHLEYGNYLGDTYWGTVDGQGRNMLGKILMQVRGEVAVE